MSMFYHCPICWDGEEVCKCTQADFDKFYKEIEERKKQAKKEQRKEWHKMLDKSFDVWEKRESFESYEAYFAKYLLKQLSRDEWLKMRNAFNEYYKAL